MQGANPSSDRRETRRGTLNNVVATKGQTNARANQLTISQNMLSQDSIKNYVEDAEKETQEERRRLELQDSQKKQYAKKMLQNAHLHNAHPCPAEEEQTNQNNVLNNFTMNNKKKLFGKFADGSSKEDRLNDLLSKVEEYSRFILKQNINAHNANLRNKNAGDQNGAQNSNFKAAGQKRRVKKSGKGQDSDGGSDDENQGMLTRLTTQPSSLKGEFRLRDYQLDGLNWMISLYETGINGILADEMGLGKTIQTISLISFLREFKSIRGFHLIIMPKSVVGNWMSEFNRWLPDCRVVNLIAKKENREDIIKNQIAPGNFDVCITTFEGVRICMSALMKFKWQYIIIDEAHKIKNEDSQTSKRIRQLNSKNRLLLTGTPLQNNLHELWSLLNFLLPEIFASSDDFDQWFDLGAKGNEELTNEEKEIKNTEVVKQLHKILRPFMLRRIKREVEKSLLPKIEMHIQVGITETQKSIYRQLLKKSTIDKGTTTSHYKNILVQLRKVCDHPYLFQGIEEEGAPELGDHLIKTCGKMQFMDKLLKKSYEDKSQTLIFSGFTSMLDILEDYCRFREYKYCRLDGNTELDDRQSQIDDFTSPGTDKFIFLISTRAGGLGLNLMTANTVILYDSDWNPQMDLQAMDRAHRIGQKKQVRVYRLITKNTMEEKMVEKQTMKLKLDSLIIQKGRMAPKNTGLQKDDLKDMVNYGADAIFEIGSNIDDEDIEEMIRNGEEKAKNLSKQAEDLMKEKFDMVNFEMTTCNLYQFEDVDYIKEKRKDAEALLQKNVIAMLDQEHAETGGRRKVKKNMAESSICPNIFANGNVGVSGEAKKKRLAKVTDFRFYPDPDRLRELILIEMESKYSGYVQGMEGQMFTPEMKIEKDILESKGFNEWDRREYQKFIQALELYATDDYANISKHIQGTKTPEEVKEYATVFFEKVNSLHDSDKIIQKVQKAQKNVNFNLRAPYVIKQKIDQYPNPFEDMNLTFATQKSKFFSKETDIILLCLADKYGYGNWGDIKKALRREQRCRFEHIFISRSEEELKKRIIYLVQTLEKEQEEAEKKPEKTLNGTTSLQIPDNLDFLDSEINELMIEAEEKATKALDQLNLSGNLFSDQPRESTAHQNSNKSSQDVTIPEKVEVENLEEDIQMSAASGEYDKVDEPCEVKVVVPKKVKEVKKKKNLSQGSNESGIRMGALGDNNFCDQDDDMEEDDILKRELGENTNSIAESSQKKNEVRATTADTSNITDQNRSSSKRAQPKQTKAPAPAHIPSAASSKSAKQLNLADWVSSATKTSASKNVMNGTAAVTQNLVGQKRILQGGKKPQLKNKKQSTEQSNVSEFDARE